MLASDYYIREIQLSVITYYAKRWANGNMLCKIVGNWVRLYKYTGTLEAPTSMPKTYKQVQ